MKCSRKKKCKSHIITKVYDLISNTCILENDRYYDEYMKVGMGHFSE